MITSNLRKVLYDKHISILELSEKTGISRASLSQLAKNESKMIKFETLDKLVDSLGVPISEILIDDSQLRSAKESEQTNEKRADAVIDELHELNKTLKVIASNQERSELNLNDVRDAIKKNTEETVNLLFESKQKDPS